MHMHTYTHTCTHGYRCMYMPTHTQIENLSKRRMDTPNNITPCSEAYTKCACGCHETSAPTSVHNLAKEGMPWIYTCYTPRNHDTV